MTGWFVCMCCHFDVVLVLTYFSSSTSSLLFFLTLLVNVTLASTLFKETTETLLAGPKCWTTVVRQYLPSNRAVSLLSRYASHFVCLAVALLCSELSKRRIITIKLSLRMEPGQDTSVALVEVKAGCALSNRTLPQHVAVAMTGDLTETDPISTPHDRTSPAPPFPYAIFKTLVVVLLAIAKQHAEELSES